MFKGKLRTSMKKNIRELIKVDKDNQVSIKDSLKEQIKLAKTRRVR